MKNRLDIIRALYEEGEDPELLRRDPEFREEYESLGEVKARLDSRVRQRPDHDVLERVVSAAAPGPRTDRRPVARRSARYRALWASSGATVIVALIAVSLWQLGSDPGAPLLRSLSSDQERVASAPAPRGSAAEDEAVAGAVDRMDRPPTGAEFSRGSGAAADETRRSGAAAVDEIRSSVAANRVHGSNAKAGADASKQTITPAGAAAESVHVNSVVRRETVAGDRLARSASELQQSAALAEGAWTPDSMLTWDESGDLLELYRTIERLKAGADLVWDEPVVPLEMLRAGSSSRGLHEAGRRE